MDEQAIPFLKVTDAERALRWYARLGFTERWRHRFAPDLPLFVEVGRGPMRLFLSEHDGDARPDGLVYLRVNDIDAIAAAFATTAENTEWGTRELALHDPDGNRLRLGAPLD